MTIRYTERPKSAATMDYKSPESSREYAVWGSDSETEIILYMAGVSPRFDAGIDAVTLAPITLFRGKIDINAEGTAVWTVKVHYGSSPSTIELSFTLGVQSTKIQLALADVRSYSCILAVSTTTTAAAGAARIAAAFLTPDLVANSAANTTMYNAAAAASTAAQVGGVDATVNTNVLTCVVACTALVTDNANVAIATNGVISAVNACADAADEGNAAAAATATTNVLNFRATLLAAKIQALADKNNAVAAAAAATTAASGGNAQTIAAAAAAETAATAATALYNVLNTTNTDALTAETAATDASEATAADQAPGGNGVPDFKRAIGVEADGKVEGCEIETGKVCFTITKKWQRAVLPSSYLITLAEMTDRTVVNHALWTFAWLGQTLSFPRGSLRFRGSAIKSSSLADLEITYDFSFQRPITEADNYTMGQSAKITKEGMEYVWIRFVGKVSEGVAVAQPQDAHVVRVYPYDDFARLQL